jgi:hypothetical protein
MFFHRRVNDQKRWERQVVRDSDFVNGEGIADIEERLLPSAPSGIELVA